MPLEIETTINILTTSKKTGQRDYYKEYELTPEITATILLESGFPEDKKDELKKFSIDLTCMAIFKQRLGTSTKAISLSDCFSQVIGRTDGVAHDKTGKGIISDLSWNQTVDEIIGLMEKQ